ncbi:MAG: hypothetical protein ABR587_07900 [Candidatus Binatia bacterium]
MKQPRTPLVSLLAGFGLVLLLADGGLAQYYDPYDPSVQHPPAAPAPGRIGPGAPPSQQYDPPLRPFQRQPRVEVMVQPGIHIAPVVPLAQTVNVHGKVLGQCQPQVMLPLLIAERHPEVVVSDAQGGTRLELAIVDIHAPSGGLFSGSKGMTVEGVLIEGNTVLGTFVARRTSMASTATCGMLAKVSIVLATDIARWLYQPGHDSRLGQAR